MSPLCKKLNLKDPCELLLLNAPASFETEVAQMQGLNIFRGYEDLQEIHCLLAFITQKKDLNDLVAAIITKIKSDALLWFAYPKQSSKIYHCDFNRDTGWDVLGAAGFEAVRQIAIDKDWSALRFRRTTFIKSLTRDSKRALSLEGKARSLLKD